MNLERTMKLGQLAERESEAKQLAIKLHGIKLEMRVYLAEHINPQDLAVDRLRQLSEELGQAHTRHDALLREITVLREELGLPRYENR
jgi:hypothetical protein